MLLKKKPDVSDDKGSSPQTKKTMATLRLQKDLAQYKS